MARLAILCPICGDELDTKVKQTVMPGELVLDITVKPCASWCSMLRRPNG